MRTTTGRFISILLIFSMLVSFIPSITIIAQGTSLTAFEPAMASATEVELTDVKKQELNMFFGIFSNLLHDDYNIDEIDKSNDSLLQFALFYEYRSYDLFYDYDSHDIDVYTIPHDEFKYDDNWNTLIPDSYVDGVLSRFFDVSNINHRSLSWCEYKDGNYHFMPADGELLKYPKVTNFHRNGDGTYSARIELYTNNEYYDDLPKGEQLVGYQIAIIQPYVYNGKDTYKLIYWKTAEKDTPIPNREPLTNSVDIAKINSFTSKNNQTKFNLDETIYLTVKTNLAVTNVRYEYRHNGVWKYDELYATIPISSTQTEKTWTTNFALTIEKIDAVRVIASNEHSEDIKIIDIIIVLDEEEDANQGEEPEGSTNTKSIGDVSLTDIVKKLGGTVIPNKGMLGIGLASITVSFGSKGSISYTSKDYNIVDKRAYISASKILNDFFGDIGTNGAVQPTRDQAINYIVQVAWYKGIPYRIALATAMQESTFTQFVGGKTKRSGDDYGMMQINSWWKSNFGTAKWNDIMTNWHRNVDAGTDILADSYRVAKNFGYSVDDMDSLAKATYSKYNDGNDPNAWKKNGQVQVNVNLFFNHYKNTIWW